MRKLEFFFQFQEQEKKRYMQEQQRFETKHMVKY